MTSQALSSPLPVASRRRTLGVALVAALVGATAAIAVLFGHELTGGDPQTKTKELRGQGFTLAYPAGWVALTREQLTQLKGQATAVVRRPDGHGTVIVRRKAAPKDQSLRALTRGLTAGLQRRFDDFRFVSARVVQTRAGEAFLYTFTRTQAKTAQSIALVRVGSANYTLDAVASSGDPRAAREVAAIVRSFGP